MKRYLVTLPVAALMCGAAFAQTTDTTATTGGAAGTDGMYGTEWSQTVGATFYSDAEMTTMRTPEEISTSWATMTQEDRDGVMAECARYRTDSGTTAATSMGASADTTAATGTDTTAATGTDTTAAAGTDTTASGDMAAASNMGTTAANMQMLCDMVEAY